MRRLVLGCATLAVGIVSTAALATDDPIVTRKKLMQSNGGAAGLAQAMIKGEVPFAPQAAEASLRNFNAVAYSFGDYFPEGSNQGETRASPKIWEDAAGFQAALAKFQQDTDAARQAKPQDLEAFKTAMATVGQNCQSCHETFRLEQN